MYVLNLLECVGPGRLVPEATLVVLVVVGIYSLKIPKAFLIHSGVQ